MINFFVPGKPLTKSNNLQFGRGRAYVPKQYKEYEAKIKQVAEQAMTGLDPITGPVKMEVDLIFPDRRRRDAPNYLKTLCDALNEVCYKDDSQIEHLIVRKQVDKSNVGVLIKVGEIT